MSESSVQPRALDLRSGAQLVFERLRSDVLVGNALGDPTDRDLITYLPPGYDASDVRYPVVYCLTGFTGTGRNLIASGGWSEGLHERLDRLIAAAAIRPMIVVMPDCFTRLGGSQYVNSTATGRYEDYIVDEIVPHVDRRFRTLATPAGRAVIGKSSGGYGALMLAMRHADVFGLTACHSGDMYFEYCYKTEFPKLVNALTEHGSIRAFVDQFDRQVKKRGGDIEVLNLVAMAACYSPDPDADDLGIALPVDRRTGVVDTAVWKRWLEFDPVYIVDRHAAALRSLRLLYVDCGRRDEYHLHIGARELARRLETLGIAHTYEEFDDTHRDISYRYDRSLPLISAAFG